MSKSPRRSARFAVSESAETSKEVTLMKKIKVRKNSNYLGTLLG
jgi:hypothetical protein